jgi:hypothetical protein
MKRPSVQNLEPLAAFLPDPGPKPDYDWMYDDFRVKQLIISRGRWDTITTHRITEANVLVPEDEAELYAERIGWERIETIDPDVHGARAVRNWVMDHYPLEDYPIICMFDDDLVRFGYVGYDVATPIYDPVKVTQIVEMVALCALDAGCELFTLGSNSIDVRKYQANKPFSLNTMISGGVTGLIGRRIRYDDNLMIKSDADISLQHLMWNRILWMDNRWSYMPTRVMNKGGNNQYRTDERLSREMEYLKQKWGDHIRMGSYKGIEKTTIHVPRRQTMKL